VLETIKLSTQITAEFTGLRLDFACAQIFNDYSRSKLSKWIKQGNLMVNHQPADSKQITKLNDIISLDVTLTAENHFLAQEIALNVVFEDEDIIVLNKPAGLVVHPGAGNYDGTLLNALLHHSPQLRLLPRAGIVHRLDKNTTGLMVIAKNLPTQNDLINQLQNRTIHKVYQAVVIGKPALAGTINAPIARHPKNRQKMAVTSNGKEAITHFKVLQQFANHALIEIDLKTGRTHQIRVHMSHLGLPLVGDSTYGAKVKIPKNTSPELKETLTNFSRQALHAKKLTLKHPKNHQIMQFNSKLPADFSKLLQDLQNS